MASWSDIVPLSLLVLAVAGGSGCSATRDRSAGDAPAAASSITSPPVAVSSATASSSAAGAPFVGPTSPLYLAVDGVGIVGLVGDAFVPIAPTKRKLTSAALGEGPNATLYVSFQEEGTLRVRGGRVESISTKAFQMLAVRSDTDVWAVTDDYDWEVDHYDGKAWSKVKAKGDFKGKFDDDKISDLALTSDAVFVSSWNGLYRLSGANAAKVIPPPGTDSGPHRLLARPSSPELVASFSQGRFTYVSGKWNPFSWPDDVSLTERNREGVIVGATTDDHHVAFAKPGTSPPATSDAFRATSIVDLGLDESGRAWVATDYTLFVLDAKGHVIDSWDPGTLAGVDGRITRLLVNGSGPDHLPSKGVAARWEITGKVEAYKSSSPLAGAKIEICPRPTDETGCAGAPFVRATTTGVDGSFRLADVPEGSYGIHTVIPEGLEDCNTPFNVHIDPTVTTKRDCHVAANGSRTCAVPTIRTCLPFEMPPPIRH